MIELLIALKSALIFLKAYIIAHSSVCFPSCVSKMISPLWISSLALETTALEQSTLLLFHMEFFARYDLLWCPSSTPRCWSKMPGDNENRTRQAVLPSCISKKKTDWCMEFVRHDPSCTSSITPWSAIPSKEALRKGMRGRRPLVLMHSPR